MLSDKMLEKNIFDLSRKEREKIYIVYTLAKKIEKIRKLPDSYGLLLSLIIIALVFFIAYHSGEVFPYLEKNYSTEFCFFSAMLLLMFLHLILYLLLSLFISKPRLRELKINLIALFDKDIVYYNLLFDIKKLDEETFRLISGIIPELLELSKN